MMIEKARSEHALYLYLHNFHYVQVVFDGCSCVSENDTVTGGLCESDCKSFIPYVAVLFVATFVNGMFIIPAMTTTMRLVSAITRIFMSSKS